MNKIKQILKNNKLTKKFYIFLYNSWYFGIKKALHSNKIIEESKKIENNNRPLPNEFYCMPNFISKELKSSYAKTPNRTNNAMKSYVARVLMGYARYGEKNAAMTIDEIKNLFKLAIKYDIKETTFPIYYLMDFIWRYDGVTNELLELGEEFFNSPYAYAEGVSRGWLIYISSLIEIRHEDKALIVLEKYYENFKDKDIHNFYPVSDFMMRKFIDKQVIINEKIQKSAYVFRIIQNNMKQNIWEKYLTGKRVAIVGSSDRERGLNHGEYIDNFDVVIRFNNFKTKGYEKDYGSKVDVWTRNVDPKVDSRLELAKYVKIIMLEVDIWHYFIDNKFVDIFYQYVTQSAATVCYLNNKQKLIKEIGSYPTSGALIIDNVHEVKGIKEIEYFGFSF